jgi:glucosyl-3-phosphoglycerate synthase
MTNEEEERPWQTADRTTPSQPYRVLVALSNLAEAEILLPLAEAIVAERSGQLVILHVMTVPEGHPLSEATARASHSRTMLRDFLNSRSRGSTKPWESVAAEVRTVVRVAREVWEEIWTTVEQEQIDLLVLAWRGQALSDTAVDRLVDQRLSAPPCDVVAVRPAAGLASPEGWQGVSRILLPTRGGPDAGLSLRVAHALAGTLNADITLLRVTGQAPRDAEEQLFAEFAPALRGLEHLKRSVVTVGDVSQAIIEEAGQQQVLVMGTPPRHVAGTGWRGSVFDTVAEDVTTTLIVVKSRGGPTQLPGGQTGRRLRIPRTELHDLGSVEVPRERPVTVVVDKWFAENTFRSHEFADLERLIALKEEQGLTISLGLPALNEEETIGHIIETIKTALMDDVPLLDEMVLIDSGSVDYTREIAADFGIPVYIHQDILPQYGVRHGKGEGLWKSLYVLEGDIIAWIDTDIKNIHPRFVYGVVGPLLQNPVIQYVKGFYRRPLKQGDKLVAGGGGRVTELTARPLINLFFPELSGLIQPLSGEYAGRRQALERLPFFSGYGVEIGLLIDILEKFGLHAIAQVDLLKRIHHNQPLPSLSKMSFAIIQVVVRRLEERHKSQLLEDANKTMNLIRYEPRRFFLESLEIRERERPPMITLPEYRQKRGLDTEPVEGETDHDV